MLVLMCISAQCKTFELLKRTIETVKRYIEFTFYTKFQAKNQLRPRFGNTAF